MDTRKKISPLEKQYLDKVKKYEEQLQRKKLTAEVIACLEKRLAAVRSELEYLRSKA
jgi:hypothetical protein